MDIVVTVAVVVADNIDWHHCIFQNYGIAGGFGFQAVVVVVVVGYGVIMVVEQQLVADD